MIFFSLIVKHIHEYRQGFGSIPSCASRRGHARHVSLERRLAALLVLSNLVRLSICCILFDLWIFHKWSAHALFLWGRGKRDRVGRGGHGSFLGEPKLNALIAKLIGETDGCMTKCLS